MGSMHVAYLTDATELQVKNWLEGSSDPNIEQLDTIVFTWSIYERLRKTGMDLIDIMLWFNIMLDEKTTINKAIRDGRCRGEILQLLEAQENGV